MSFQAIDRKELLSSLVRHKRGNKLGSETWKDDDGKILNHNIRERERVIEGNYENLGMHFMNNPEPVVKLRKIRAWCKENCSRAIFSILNLWVVIIHLIIC